MDGVCGKVLSYLPTPPQEREKLSTDWPDAVAFTHIHGDHFDKEYAEAFQRATGKPIVAPREANLYLPGEVWSGSEFFVGNVKITAVPTRHIGHWGQTTEHQSYVVEGSKVIWFLGDASPLQLKAFSPFPKPDILMIPYAFVSSPSAIKLLEQYLPCKIILLHLPAPEDDPDGIWQAIGDGVKQLEQYLYLPQMGESVCL